MAKNIQIVICDGSGFDFSEIVAKKFPEANIECLFFENNRELVALYGKGYGEGEIVKYALENSKYLKDAQFFAKCTAKLWVSNFFKCLKDAGGPFSCNCVFSNYKSVFKLKFEHIDTRFYITNKLFFLENFASAYLNVRDQEGHYLEHCFRDVVIEKKLNKIITPIFPIIEGVSGSSGVKYSNSIKNKIKFSIKRLILKTNKII